MSNTENSALIALSELKDLEAMRVAEVESEKRAKEESERRTREEAERRAREIADRKAREEAERIARETAEQEARDREERLRLQEADLRARAEQEARLKEEQMRLDAQVKLAEKKARPLWLYGVLGMLAIGLGVGGYMIYERDEAAELAAIEQKKKDIERQKQDDARAAEMATLMKELKGLQEEQNKIKQQKDDIENQLRGVQDETERQKLLAKQAALDAQLTANADKQKKNKGKSTTKSDGEPKSEKPKGGISVSKNVDDPLDGL